MLLKVSADKLSIFLRIYGRYKLLIFQLIKIAIKIWMRCAEKIKRLIIKCQESNSKCKAVSSDRKLTEEDSFE